MPGAPRPVPGTTAPPQVPPLTPPRAPKPFPEDDCRPPSGGRGADWVFNGGHLEWGVAGSPGIDPCERTCITRQSVRVRAGRAVWRMPCVRSTAGPRRIGPIVELCMPGAPRPVPGTTTPPQAPPLNPPGTPRTGPGGHRHPPQAPAVKTPGRRCTAPGTTAPTLRCPPLNPRAPRHRPGGPCTPSGARHYPPGVQYPDRGSRPPPPGTDARRNGPTDVDAADPNISVRPRAPRRGTARRTTATGRRHRAPSPPPRRSRSCGPRRRSTRGACTPPRTARRR